MLGRGGERCAFVYAPVRIGVALLAFIAPRAATGTWKALVTARKPRSTAKSFMMTANYTPSMSGEACGHKAWAVHCQGGSWGARGIPVQSILPTGIADNFVGVF